MFNISRSLVAAVALVVLGTASPVFAGPPLICHPFQTRGGALLAWGTHNTDTNWNQPVSSYDLTKLSADLTRLLDAETPVLTRMENLRRATIYASKDPAIARQLLEAVMGRALSMRTGGSQAWFDAGYLIETYRQGVSIRERKGQAGWAAVDATIKTDGYGFVKKAMAMAATPSAEMEYAASLMTQGSQSAEHRARAAAAAANGSALATNLARY